MVRHERPRPRAGWRSALHASKSKGRAADREKWLEARRFVADRFGEQTAVRIPPVGFLPMGGIVGRATVTGVVRPKFGASVGPYPDGVDPRWHFVDQFAYVLERARPTPFISWVGSQAAVTAPASLLSLVEAVPSSGTCSVCGRKDVSVVNNRCANASVCVAGSVRP